MGTSKFKAAVLGLAALICSLLFAGCGMKGQAVDPGTWGYESLVTYDALGGMVNARGVRKTYYLNNSYVFKPSGSSNMLVEPVKDGYILAGWYTAKADAEPGSVEEYKFSSADRWDFNIDRVQGDITLYARWLPRARVNYVDAATGEVIFTKNITADSPIQELSSSVLSMSTPDDKSFAGYYADAECTEKYDFTSYVHVDPTPTEAELYVKLSEMFPQYFERIEYVEPEETPGSEVDTSWMFLNKLGYALTEAGLGALDEIESAKDQLVEEDIETYLVNTANRVVYMQFTEGSFVRVKNAQDLKIGNKYGFFDTDAAGNHIDGYTLDADIDLSGVTFTMSESFSGIVNGNGHTLSNLTVAVKGKRIDNDTSKQIGLAAIMDGATFNDVTFEDSALTVDVKAGIKVTGGLLAAQGKNVTFNNCRFNGLFISSGKGDDGGAKYALGDLFGVASGCVFNNCSADALTVEVFDPGRLTLSVFTLPAPAETPAEGGVNP